MKRLLLICAGLTLIQSMAIAEPFQVTPMRLELEAGGNFGNITVYNSGESSMDMQVKAMTWSQSGSNGDDQLQPTKKLTFFPKIFSIPAKGKQVIRVGYQGKVEGNEKSFRLFIRELPVDITGQTGARFVVQISMPAFIYSKGVAQPKKPLITGIEVDNGKLVARAKNPNQRYYSMNKIEILGKKGNEQVYDTEVGGWYVLAGASRIFPLGISQKDCLKMDTIELTGHALLGQDHPGESTHVTFPVNQAMCNKIKP